NVATTPAVPMTAEQEAKARAILQSKSGEFNTPSTPSAASSLVAPATTPPNSASTPITANAREGKVDTAIKGQTAAEARAAKDAEAQQREEARQRAYAEAVRVKD